MNVKNILDTITVNQGGFLEDEGGSAELIQRQAVKIEQMVQAERESANSGVSEDSEGRWRRRKREMVILSIVNITILQMSSERKGSSIGP